MELISEIRKAFANLPSIGMLQLNELPKEYPGYALRDANGYGVAIEISDTDLLISEHFANARYHTCTLIINNEQKYFLVVQSYREDLRMEFATLCAQFLEPGENGKARKQLLDNPITWWDNWKDLLGNSINEKCVYSIVAELLTLNYIMDSDATAEWSNNGAGTHDIECEEKSIEVKSTINKYSSKMVASGQFQLNSDKDLYIYFVRMEPSTTGYSINSLVDALEDKGYNIDKLEQMLLNRGYERGASSRELCFDILEKRKYFVDDDFPKIVDSSFKDDKIPLGITQIQYTIDLDAIEHTEW